MNKADCFNLGTLYRSIEANIYSAEHELREMDLNELQKMTHSVMVLGSRLKAEYFPRDKVVDEVVRVSGDLTRHIRWVILNMKVPAPIHVSDWTDGLASLKSLVETRLFKLIASKCS